MNGIKLVGTVSTYTITPDALRELIARELDIPAYSVELEFVIKELPTPQVTEILAVIPTTV